MATYQVTPSGPYFQYSDLPALFSPDVVQFERGYNYDSFDLDGLSGVTFGTFGTGTEPTFSSLRTASLSSLDSNLYECTDAELGDYLNVVLVDGLPREKGRFPKDPDEYFTISSDSSDGTLNHGTLPFAASGEVVIRLQGFITNTYPVTSDAAGVISFTGFNGAYPPKEGYGFALQNQAECLSEHGDWMYNSTTKKITIYLTSVVPVQYAVQEEIMTIVNCDNLIFSGLKWTGSNGDTINASNSDDIAFISCKTQYSGGMGIRLDNFNCNDFTFTDCRSDDAFAGGFYATAVCNRIKAYNCVAKNIGMVEGGSRYMNYDGRSNGFCFEGGDDNLYENCLSEDTGFNGFVYNGNGTQVVDCLAKRFCSKKADGGGFYTYMFGVTTTTRLKLKRCIARDGVGRIAGTLDTVPNAQGFYFDNGTNGVDIQEWCLSVNNPTGTYCHDMYNCDLSGMVNYGNGTQLRMNNNTGQPFSGNTFTNIWNITTAIEQQMVSVAATLAQISGFGTFSNNKYSNFKTGKSIFSVNDGSGAPNFFKYAVNPLVWFGMVGETDYEIDEYDEIPYSIVTQLGHIDYQTTIPDWDEFGYIGSVPTVYDASGATITKSGSPKSAGFLRLGPVEQDTWYLVEGDNTTDWDNLQVDFESNYTAPGNPISNYKIDSTLFALPIFSSIDRAVEQFYLLMEAPFTSKTFKELTFSEITVSRTVSTAVIDIDEENHTWEIYLDGELPPDLDITFPSESFVYDGSEKTLAIVGTLPEGYTVEYSNNGRTNVGTQVVTATVTDGVDELILTADLTITAATITGITFEDASYVYDGTQKSVTITGALPSGTSVAYLNNTRTNAGTQEVTATISGANYTTLVLYADLTITGEDITGITFENGSFVYDGISHSLNIIGTLPDGASVSYLNNSRVNVGTQQVTASITGANYNPLTLYADLTITAATITGVTFEDAAFTYDGSEKSISVTGSIPSGSSVSYLNNTRTEVGTQEATATISGSNYNTLILFANLTINPAVVVGDDEVVRLKSKVNSRCNVKSKISGSIRLKNKIR